MMPGRRTAASAAAVALLMSSMTVPSLAFELFGREFFEREDETIVVPDAQPYALEFVVEGGDVDLSRAIRNASALAREEGRPPPGAAGLIARARGDYGRILAALYAEGRYGGSIDIRIDGVAVQSMRPDAILPDPVPVRVVVDPGPLFRFGAIRIEGLPAGAMTQEDDEALALDTWELTEGAAARSGIVLASEGRLVELWRQRGHPKARVATRDVIADHRSRTVDVTLIVDPGPAAGFGEVEVTGTERLDPGYVRWMTGIPPGEEYDPDAVARARDRLLRLGVFASVSIVEGETVGDDGLLPITFNVSERKRRLIGGGASYATIDGATLEGYWMHRNLFGHAESLRFDASVSRIGAADVTDFSYALATTFRRPGTFTPDTDFTLQLAGKRESLDEYDSRTVSAKAGVEHRFTNRLTGRTALNAEWAEIDDAFGESRFLIVSLPSKLDYDGRDNKLDPTEGLRGTFDAEPLADLRGGTLALVARSALSGYLSLSEDDRLVLAGRGSLGSIVGASLADVPATRRFFLGGGGSIRGYEYRSIGPTIGGDVVGGLSFWETSLELRYRLTDLVGIVPFIDAGAAYEESVPDFSGKIRVGAGLGIRYYTPLGPLRFDLAVPLNPDGGDPALAFYVGLGQAF
ncbi:MAG TPA: autotransporter assembly complex family protein [Propylenella sp.]